MLFYIITLLIVNWSSVINNHNAIVYLCTPSSEQQILRWKDIKCLEESQLTLRWDPSFLVDSPTQAR